jgi:NAD(P)-dependent dehydrogenase (short-subunit alcohol dehydrogenase family)
VNPPTGTALVTGANRGIGLAVAVELARRGYGVVATARSAAGEVALTEAAASAGVGDRISVITMDVTDPLTYVVPDDLSVLVNNAGYDADHLPLEFADFDEWRAMFEANVFGVAQLTSAAIPALRANAPSVVATITSSSILTPVPFYAGYRASKAAASALCDSLRIELAPFGVRVVEILPGPVDTDMFAASLEPPEAARCEDYRDMALRGAELKAEAADPMLEPVATAAAAIVDAVLAPDGPMRHSCDPLGTGLLDMWRTTDDETLYGYVADGLLAPRPDPSADA